MIDITNKWCWWIDGDERFEMACTESECHGEAQCHIDDTCLDGDERTYEVARVCHPMDFIGMDWIAKHAGADTEENICLWCDENTGAEEPSIELTLEDQEELGQMIAKFVREKASVNWWTAEQASTTTHKYIAGSNDAEGGAS